MILIPVRTQLPFFYSLSLHLLILTQLLLFSPTIAKSDPDSNPEAMRVHPLPRKRNNILIHHYARHQTQESVKKLRRLPHIFSRVLELPFRSDADVAVEEMADCFKFVAETDGLPTGGGGGGGGEIRAHTVEIHPGVTKIVVRVNESSLSLESLDELELDMWRFRLPDSIRPELVTVVCEDGELIVTVPKSAASEEEEEEDNDEDGGVGGGDGGLRGGYGDGRLVLVQ